MEIVKIIGVRVYHADYHDNFKRIQARFCDICGPDWWGDNFVFFNGHALTE